MAEPNAKEMAALVKQGRAMPPAPGSGRAGRFYIRDLQELDDAIAAVGRVKGGDPARRAVRRFVMKRARELGAADKIPATWNGDGSLKTG